MMKRLLLLTFTFLLFQKTNAQSANGQPATGPGGSNYNHSAVTFTKFGTTISDCYWLYEPASPTPDSAVVVVFWHGTSSQNDIDNVPSGQKLFCEHICKKGYTVIYPLYQYGGNTLPFNQQITNGGNVLLMALNNLDTGANRVRPLRNLSGKILLGGTGISRGGGMTMNIATSHITLGLPSFDALCAFVPGAGQPMTGIDTSTKVLVVNGQDNTLNYSASQEAFDSLHHIPCANKHLIVVNSDHYGLPDLSAEHNFAGSGDNWADSARINALDFLGSWKFSVGLFDCVFKNQYCNYCLGADTLITYMGIWSDGTPIVPATIADTCCVQQNISLASGWNTISGYVIPNSPGMPNVFQNIVANIIIVKNNTGQTYIPALGINTIGNWDYKQGYKVKTSAVSTLTLSCTNANPTTPISLSTGWSLISYLRSTSMSISTALASLSSNIIIVKNNAGQSYIPALGVNTIGNMLPGQGYQIKLSALGTLTYPQ